MTVPDTGTTEQAVTFRVTLHFRKDAPSSSGWWTNPAVAERKFTEWAGTAPWTR